MELGGMEGRKEWRNREKEQGIEQISSEESNEERDKRRHKWRNEGMDERREKKEEILIKEYRVDIIEKQSEKYLNKKGMQKDNTKDRKNS